MCSYPSLVEKREYPDRMTPRTLLAKAFNRIRVRSKDWYQYQELTEKPDGWAYWRQRHVILHLLKERPSYLKSVRRTRKIDMAVHWLM